MTQNLTAAQGSTLTQLEYGLSVTNTVMLSGYSSLGVTTVLKELHRAAGGAFLSASDFVPAMRGRDPLALEETFEQLAFQALLDHPRVILDDMTCLTNVVESCSNHYPRNGWLGAVAVRLCKFADQMGKKLIFGGNIPQAVRERSLAFYIPYFEPEDYRAFCAAYLPEASAARLDYDKIHRFARYLNAYQLKNACLWLANDDHIDTVGFIDYLRSQGMASNVDLSEVRPVRFEDLVGVDDVLASLETQIVLPFENDDAAAKFGLKPKRGVLLLGPPGTGKTTVGRALAHRLQSKFFVIDGTFISGSDSFYWKVDHLFESARQNAPAVVFIDDCDAIFEAGRDQGFYRYLLTKLDGLESESMGRICVVLTAMTLEHLPAALVRSGRIELWLQMKLPDLAARREILRRCSGDLASQIDEETFDQLAIRTEGFTGADLGRIVDDGKNMWAHARFRNGDGQLPGEFLLRAIDELIENKRRFESVGQPSKVDETRRVSF